MPYLLVETTNMRIPPPSMIYFATLLPVLALTMSSCSKKEAADNHLRYLQESDQQCVPHDAKRMEYITNLPSGFLTGFQGNQMEIAKNRLAGIPDRDLDHLIWTFSNRRLSGVKPAALFFGVAGLTTLSSGSTKNGFRGMVATSITTGGNQSGFAMQHEVGHAVEIVAREAAQNTEYKNFDQALRDVVAELNSKGGLIRGYAKSSPGEAWAESYANFYCSPNSQAFIRNNLPRTFKFLTVVLPPARWDSPSNPAPVAAVPPPPPAPKPAPAPAAVPPSSVASQPSSPTPASPGLQAPPAADKANDASAEGAGAWLDRILHNIDKSTLKVSDAIRQAFLKSAEGSVDAIRLAVVDREDGDDETGLMFAADGDVDRIALCFEPVDTCKVRRALTLEEQQATIPRTKIIKERSFFGVHFVRADQISYLKQPFTALAYGEDGALLAVRRFMLIGRSKDANK